MSTQETNPKLVKRVAFIAASGATGTACVFLGAEGADQLVDWVTAAGLMLGGLGVAFALAIFAEQQSTSTDSHEEILKAIKDLRKEVKVLQSADCVIVVKRRGVEIRHSWCKTCG